MRNASKDQLTDVLYQKRNKNHRADLANATGNDREKLLHILIEWGKIRKRLFLYSWET
jgi:hypothetical protein